MIKIMPYVKVRGLAILEERECREVPDVVGLGGLLITHPEIKMLEERRATGAGLEGGKQQE